MKWPNQYSNDIVFFYTVEKFFVFYEKQRPILDVSVVILEQLQFALNLVASAIFRCFRQFQNNERKINGISRNSSQRSYLVCLCFWKHFCIQIPLRAMRVSSIFMLSNWRFNSYRRNLVAIKIKCSHISCCIQHRINKTSPSPQKKLTNSNNAVGPKNPKYPLPWAAGIYSAKFRKT